MTKDVAEIDFDPYASPNEYLDLLEKMKKCPVAHSNTDGGFWIVTGFKDSMRVLTDWQTFVSPSRIPKDFTFDPPMPPIDYNPPLQRDFRALMNPYFTPEYVEQFRPQIVTIVNELIDDFVDDGRCEITNQFSRPVASRMTFELLFDVKDRAERERNMGWAHDMVYGNEKGLSIESRLDVERQWMAWIDEFIARRRTGPRRNDVMDGLLHGTVEGGRPLTHKEIVGAVKILTLGGFGTTADSTANLIIRLCEDPTLEARLRGNADAISSAIEENIRLYPPIAGMTRTCAKDTELAGVQISATDRVLLLFASANRDPSKFVEPEAFNLDRSDAHISFSGGPHRCLGSNFARLSLSIIFERFLDRLEDIRLVEGAEVHRGSAPGTWYAPDRVPIEFKRSKNSALRL